MQLQLDMTTNKEWDLLLEPNARGQYNFVWQDDEKIDLPQRIKYYLRTYRGEYPIRENIGLPYFQQFFVKGTEIAAIENTISQYIMKRLREDTAYEILEIDCNIANYDAAKRSIELFLFVKTSLGEITINEIF